MAWTCNATLKTLVLLYLSHHAFASSDLLKTCGAKSAASITAGAAKCAASVLNAVNNCPAACHALRAAVANSSEPTYCQKATVSLPAFKAATRSNYIRVSQLSWRERRLWHTPTSFHLKILHHDFALAQLKALKPPARPNLSLHHNLFHQHNAFRDHHVAMPEPPKTLPHLYSPVYLSLSLFSFVPQNGLPKTWASPSQAQPSASSTTSASRKASSTQNSCAQTSPAWAVSAAVARQLCSCVPACHLSPSGPHTPLFLPPIASRTSMPPPSCSHAKGSCGRHRRCWRATSRMIRMPSARARCGWR